MSTCARSVALAPAVVLAPALVLALVGCFASDRNGDAPPRMARTFLPVGSSWIPERDVPREPQRTPHMVIWELSAHAGRAPTPAEQAAADAFVARAFEAAERHGWFDFERGLADGFHLMHGDRRHYYNERYVFDDVVLDPDRPEFLMYYGTPSGQKLAGMMFYTRRPDERGEQFGGPLTVWHYHVWSSPNCLVDGLLSVGTADEHGRCERGEPRSRTPEMIHVWFLDHPEGPFATSMWLEPEQLRALIERDERRALARRARP